MKYTEYKHIEDLPPYSILKSPVGGYWVVTFDPGGELILKHSTRSLRAARSVIVLERQIDAILHEDSQHVPE